MPSLRRRQHPAPRLLRGDHDVDDRAIRLGSGQVQRGVLAIGAGRREHDLDAGKFGGPARLENAAPDRRDHPIESRIEPAGAGRTDQLFPQRLDCGVGLG